MAWFPCNKSGGGIKKGGILNVQAPAPGQSGYINFARIKVLDNYANHTCCFVIQNRGIYFPVMLSLGFQNIEGLDPGLISFLYWGAADYGIYAVQNTTSVWDLYVKKTEPHDAVEILNLNYDTAHFEITFPNVFTEEKGEDWISPEIAGRCASSLRVLDSGNGEATTFSFAKPGLVFSEFQWLAGWFGDSYEIRGINKNIFTYLKKAGNYYGMCIPYEDGTGANDQTYIRTPSDGLIPYQSGEIDSAHSSLGTNAWWFASSFIRDMHAKYLTTNEIRSNHYTLNDPGAVHTVQQQMDLFEDHIEFYTNDPYGRAYFGASLYAARALKFIPNMTNIGFIGDANRKWNQFYAINSSISTSDRNEKKEISYIGQESQYGNTAMSDELLVKFIMGLLPCIFKRKDGESGRPHHGIISQDFEELMKKLGIKDHAAFIKSPKTEEIEITNEDGSKGIKVQEIPGEYVYGIRYEELEGDIIRFCQILYQQNQEQQEKIESLEKRLTDLENIIKQRA